MRKTLLIIEDDSMLNEFYKEYLENEGIDADFATDGDQGYACIKENDYDLILVDLMLPKPAMSGIEMLKRLKEESELEKENVYIFSVLKKEEVKETPQELGVKDHLIKSDYTPKEFTELIKDLIQKHQQEN